MSGKSLTFIDTNRIVIDSFWIDTDCKPYIEDDLLFSLTNDILDIPSVFEIKHYSGLQFHTDCYLHELEDIYNQVNNILQKYNLLLENNY